jgi:hypothetical protein
MLLGIECVHALRQRLHGPPDADVRPEDGTEDDQAAQYGDYHADQGCLVLVIFQVSDFHRHDDAALATAGNGRDQSCVTTVGIVGVPLGLVVVARAQSCKIGRHVARQRVVAQVPAGHEPACRQAALRLPAAAQVLVGTRLKQAAPDRMHDQLLAEVDLNRQPYREYQAEQSESTGSRKHGIRSRNLPSLNYFV